jgi:hypothetical protein
MNTAIQAQSLTPFEPANIEQAMSLATTLSKSGLIPDSLKNKPADVLVVLMTGRELGIGPMQSLRGISVIKGKPVLSADLMLAQCLRHRDVCEWFRLVESTTAVARYQTKRAGSEPVDMAWTMDDAKRAGLDGGQNWRNHPAAMLRARCSAALARAVYPDLVGGIYEEGEGEEIAGKAKPTPVVALAPPVETDVTPPAEVVAVEVAPSEAVEEAMETLTAATLWDRFVSTYGKTATVEWKAAWQKVGIPNIKPDALTQAQIDALAATMDIKF